MVSKILLTLSVLVAVAVAVPLGFGWGGIGAAGNPWAIGAVGNPWAGGPAGNPWAAGAVGNPWAVGGANPWAVGGANPFVPPWVAAAPWYPQWTQCTGIGASCADCTTVQVCTKIGGITRACTNPTLPYCNLGECSATPTTECAPVSAVPATA